MRNVVCAVLLSLLWIPGGLAEEQPAAVPAPEYYAGPWVAGQALPAYDQAMQEMENQNYHAAWELLAKVAGGEGQHHLVPWAKVKMAECHMNLGEYDQALALLEEMLAGKPGTLWEARVRVERAVLSALLPGYCLRYEGKCHYNSEARQGDQEYAVYAQLEERTADLQAARVLFRVFVEKSGGAVDPCDAGRDVRHEWMAADRLLAGQLYTGGYGYYAGDDPTDERPFTQVSLEQPYEELTLDREKVLWLLAECEQVCKDCPDRNPVAGCREDKAMFLATFPELPDAKWSQAEQKKSEEYYKAHPDGKPPYEPARWTRPPEVDPVVIAKSLVDEFPLHPDHERYLGLYGRYLAADHRYEDAVAVFEGFIKQFPESRYVKDVEASLREITAPWFSLYVQSVSYAGLEFSGAVTVRNIEALEVEWFHVPAAEFLAAKWVTEYAETALGSLLNLGDARDQMERLIGSQKAAATTRVTATPAKKYETASAEFKPELKAVGLYVYRVKSGEIVQYGLHVHSDVLLVSRGMPGKTSYYVADAVSGKPQAGAEVVVREQMYKRGLFSDYQEVKVHRLKSGADGLVDFTFTSGPKVYSNSASAFVVRNGEVLAVSDYDYPMYYGTEETGGYVRGFIYTDRPAYRPGDTVRFRVIARDFRDGVNLNVPGKRFHCLVSGPTGAKTFEGELTADEFGTVDGQFAIEEGAALGMYYFTMWEVSAQGQETYLYLSAGATIRVEEYKKPEFKVTVKPSAEQALIGEKVSVTVGAEYYFGGAVAGGAVRYAITRTPYYHWWFAPSRWDWLYGTLWGQGYYPYYYGRQEVVKDGEGTLDEKGELVVELPAAEVPKEGQTPIDYVYYVSATVTDKSRRVISGDGSVTVTKDPFYIHFVTKSDYFVAGDEAEVEVRAMTANDTPVAARGTYKLLKVEHKAGEKEPKKTEVVGGPVSLDKDGTARVLVKLPSEGNFELAVSLSKEGGKVVEAAQELFAAGKERATTSLRFAGLMVLTDKRDYAPGETARILVGAPTPGFVLLTAEGGGTVFYQKLVEMKDTGLKVELPITDKHVPNFYLSAVMVRDRNMLYGEKSIYVPPADKMLNIVMTTDKEVYKPGEKGTVEVAVTDKDGKPARTEVGLYMFDASVLYIQPEIAGDIRQYFFGQVRYQGITTKHSGYTYLPYRLFMPEPPFYAPGELPYVPDYDYSYYATAGYGWDGWGAAGMPYGGYGKDGGAYGFADQTVTGMLGGAGGVGLLKEAKAAEAPAAPMARAEAAERSLQMDGRGDMGGGQPMAAREYFPDTVLWAPGVVTGADGKGKAEVTFPDSLTTWAVRGVGVTEKDLVGQAAGSVVTSKKVIARLETPRFLVEGDKALLAAVIRSTLAAETTVELKVEAVGVKLTGDDEATVTLKPGEEKRVDFAVEAGAAGSAAVTLLAVSPEESDALKKSFPVVEWGAFKLVSGQAVVKGGEKGTIGLELPSDRKEGTAELTVVGNATLSGVLVSALPYLLDYPYGCVEQTMSRLLPAVMVQQALAKAGLSLDGLAALPDKGTLAEPLSTAGKWYKGGVFTQAGLDEVVSRGLARLYGMQGYDGGWGWWGGGESDAYMTAYVMMGLSEARQAGVEVDEMVWLRGFSYLENWVSTSEQKNRHVDVFVGYALALSGGMVPPGLLDGWVKERGEYTIYGKALLALTLAYSGRTEEANLLLDNLKDGAWVDKEHGTASFKEKKGLSWWWWWENRTEAVAWALRAFLAIRPDDDIADGFAKWLVENREATHWDSTRLTALSILSLLRYMEVRGDLNAEYEAIVYVNGDERKRWKVGRDNALTFNGSLALSDRELESGDLSVEVEVKGTGRFFAAAFLTYFSQEAKIEGSGSKIEVERTYYKLTPTTRTDKEWGGAEKEVRDFERQKLSDGDPVASGDLIEVQVVIAAPNDYEYLVFEDPKPAGCEPVEVQSGYVFENANTWYREYRDRKVVSFLAFLHQGTQTLSYQLRAEIPGTFRTLPHNAYAMYAPRVRATSDSGELEIKP